MCVSLGKMVENNDNWCQRQQQLSREGRGGERWELGVEIRPTGSLIDVFRQTGLGKLMCKPKFSVVCAAR